MDKVLLKAVAWKELKETMVRLQEMNQIMLQDLLKTKQNLIMMIEILMVEDLGVPITGQEDLFYILPISILEITGKMLKTLVSIETHSLPWRTTLHRLELKC